MAGLFIDFSSRAKAKTSASPTARTSRMRRDRRKAKKRPSVTRACLTSAFEYQRDSRSVTRTASTDSKERGSIEDVRLASARVRTPHHLGKIRDLDVRVALGRAEASVAEQSLDVTDIGATLE